MLIFRAWVPARFTAAPFRQRRSGRKHTVRHIRTMRARLTRGTPPVLLCRRACSEAESVARGCRRRRRAQIRPARPAGCSGERVADVVVLGGVIGARAADDELSQPALEQCSSGSCQRCASCSTARPRRRPSRPGSCASARSWYPGDDVGHRRPPTLRDHAAAPSARPAQTGILEVHAPGCDPCPRKCVQPRRCRIRRRRSRYPRQSATASATPCRSARTRAD